MKSLFQTGLRSWVFAAPLALAPLSCTMNVASEGGDEEVGVVSSALGSTVTVGSPSHAPEATFYNADLSTLFMVEGECDIRFQQMNLSSGAKHTILSGCSALDEISADNVNLFYIARTRNEIRRVNFSGSPVETLITTTDSASGHKGFFMDSFYVYWADATGIHRHPWDRGSTVTPYPHTNLDLLGIDSGYVYAQRYAASESFPYKLERVPLGGGTVRLYVATKDPIVAFTMDADNMYYATYTTSGSLSRINKTSGNFTSLMSPTADCVTDLAVNASNLYISESPGCDSLASNGVILRRSNPTGSGSFSTQKTGLHGPRALHLSSSDLYWVSGGTSPVVKRASLP